MAAHLLEPTDVIDVSNLPVVIYGPPGSGKTSLLQTAKNPITLDFDKGIHRSFNRKRAMRFDTWQDLIDTQEKGDLDGYDTWGIDTLGALLDSLAATIKAENAKNAQGGGLSIQGWGVLGNRFGQWIRAAVGKGKDVVMVCHEEEDKDVAGNRYLRPSLPGKMAYTIVHRLVDLMGHIAYDGKRRLLDFNPTDQAIGKNAAGWEPIALGKLEEQPTFLADLLDDAKRKIGKTAEASAELARTVSHFTDWLTAKPDLAAFNTGLAELSGLNPAAKRQAWLVVQRYAEASGWVLPKGSKAFVAKGDAA